MVPYDNGRIMDLRVAEIPVNGLEPHPLSAQIFGQLSPEQFDDLVADLNESGLRYPLELDIHGRVICGSQRLRAIKSLGWETVPVIRRLDLTDENAIEKWLIRDNTLRRQLTYSQMYRAGKRLETILADEARERQKGGIKVVTGPKGKTSQHVARELGISTRGYERLKTVQESGSDDLKRRVDAGLVSLSAAAKQLSRSRVQAKRIDDTRIIPLKLIKWQTRLEDMVGWLNSHPPKEYQHLSVKMRPLLIKARDIIDAQIRVIDG